MVMSPELLQGSLVLVFLWLIIGGLGAPLPEDVAVLGTGVLVHRGVVSLPVGLAVLLAGVLSGDAMLFLLAKRLGPRAEKLPVFKRLSSPERRARIERAYDQYGGAIVFLARHVMGLRAAVFAMAALHGMSLKRFLAWDALAACVSVPVMFSVGYYGSRHIAQVRAGVERTEEIVVVVVIAALLIYACWRALTTERRGRSTQAGEAHGLLR